MDWKEGTYFSVAIWGMRSWWKVVRDVDEETADCLFVKGEDPRMLTIGGMFHGFRKGYYNYGGRVEKPPIPVRCNNFLLRLFGVTKRSEQF